MKRIESPSFFIGKNSPHLISFGSGEPDLLSINIPYRSINSCSTYGSVQGEMKLRKILSRQYPKSTPDNFIITNGASEAIDLSLRAIYKSKGKVMIPKPYYYSYPENIKLSNLGIKFYNLKKCKIDYQKLENSIGGCIAIMINSPGNPTGTVQDVKTLKKIEKLAQERNIYIISDEVYRNFNYIRENYLLRGNNILTINSFSKNFNMCGHRVGYIHTKNKELIRKIVDIKSYTSMNTNILAQEVACLISAVSKKKIIEQSKSMEEKGNYMYGKMAELGLDLWKPEGSFYLFPKMKNPAKVVSDLYFKYNMIVYDGNWFGDKERVRFSFAVDKKTIDKGMKRLENYLSKEYKEN